MLNIHLIILFTNFIYKNFPRFTASNIYIQKSYSMQLHKESIVSQLYYVFIGHVSICSEKHYHYCSMKDRGLEKLKFWYDTIKLKSR